MELSFEKYSVYNPKDGNPATIPTNKGSFLIVLRPASKFIHNKQIPNTPKLTSINLFDASLRVIFVGYSKNLQEDYYNHCCGQSGNNSTFWKSIGCLMGYSLVKNEIRSTKDAMTKFSSIDENKIREWIAKNVLYLYAPNEDIQNTEQVLINVLNPPLNLLHNTNRVNAQYRKKLSELRENTTSVNKKDTYKTSKKRKNEQTTSPILREILKDVNHNRSQEVSNQGDGIFCPKCGKRLIVPENLKQEKYLRCLSCGTDFHNPLSVCATTDEEAVLIQKKSSGIFSKKRIAIIIGIIIGLFYIIIMNNDTKHFYPGEICVVTSVFPAALNEETAAALIEAAVDKDKLDFLQHIGRGHTVTLQAGEEVKIIRSTNYGYKVERTLNLQRCYIPGSVLRKKQDH